VKCYAKSQLETWICALSRLSTSYELSFYSAHVANLVGFTICIDAMSYHYQLISKIHRCNNFTKGHLPGESGEIIPSPQREIVNTAGFQYQAPFVFS